MDSACILLRAAVRGLLGTEPAVTQGWSRHCCAVRRWWGCTTSSLEIRSLALRGEQKCRHNTRQTTIS
jgi:hypothetical protein